jgi:nucleoside-diphosphate-sugar epimerase
MMRTFVAEASGAIGARLVPQLIEHGHNVIGTHRSPRTGERVRVLGAELITFGHQPARACRRIAGSS